MPRADSRCWRKHDGASCGARWAEHDPITGECPQLPGRTFQGHTSSPGRVSTSFGDEEIAAASELFTRLLRGGDVSQLLRSPQVNSFYRKVLAMRATLARRERDRAREPEGQAAE